MDAYRRPLERTHEAMQWFLVADELRLLHVHTSENMRQAVLEQIALSEHSSLNTQPFAVLEAPVEEGDDGWSLRAAELRDDWEQLTEVFAKLEPPIAMPTLGEPLTTTGVVGFAGELKWMLDNLPADFSGLTVVLAPVWVREPAEWLGTLRAFLSQPGYEKARFVIVECEDAHLAPLVDELGPVADRVDARVDPEAARRDLNAMIDNIASAPPGSGGARLSGMAGPGVQPPRRWNQPPDPEPEDMARVYFDAGLPSGLSDQERVQTLKVLILRAAQAAAEGDTAAAVRQQRAARDLAVDLGLERESIVLQMALGSYELQGGDAHAAEQSYTRARELGLEYMFADLAAQAQLALAAAQFIDGRTAEAAVSYSWAGHLAHETGQTILAIEGYRLAGQLHANDGRTDDAGNAWRQALVIAEAAEPDERKASTAAEAAEALAGLCRAHDLHDQADALDTQAALLRAEAEEPPAMAEGV